MVLVLRRLLPSLLVACVGLVGAPAARAQAAGPDQTASSAALQQRPGLWLVAGGGGVLARGHCDLCDRQGVFLYSPGILVDAGIQINRRVDVGVELSFVSSRFEEFDPIRTTFVLGVGQFRPWTDRGLSLRGGMGVGFVGNGLYNLTQRDMKPPYTTNALGVALGIGWEFLRDDRLTFQILATQHVAAIGELTTEHGSIQNVVGNYWLVGGMLVIR
jgi:hypothetical protein